MRVLLSSSFQSESTSILTIRVEMISGIFPLPWLLSCGKCSTSDGQDAQKVTMRLHISFQEFMRVAEGKNGGQYGPVL
jgi:hypothetical protein